MKTIGLSLAAITAITAIYLVGCNSSSSSRNDAETNSSDVVEIDFKITHATNNEAAYITSQCYTKTVDAQGGVHNPCFTCHINSDAPNYIDDSDLQESYDMSQYSKVNRFTNLFKDRTEAVAQISDTEMLSYIREDN
ncbi:MAG TPA: hypothetical protein ENK86_02445, partial [Campylobacterales bacterium]|nr:hypothetical protein [Campylobacterales bacterium]